MIAASLLYEVVIIDFEVVVPCRGAKREQTIARNNGIIVSFINTRSHACPAAMTHARTLLAAPRDGILDGAGPLAQNAGTDVSEPPIEERLGVGPHQNGLCAPCRTGAGAGKRMRQASSLARPQRLPAFSFIDFFATIRWRGNHPI